MLGIAGVVLGFTYWSDPRVHNLGNVGIRGAIHAGLAPFSTNLIDRVAYNGTNLRKEILGYYVPFGAKVVDLGCGVGYSTHKDGVGVDASQQMLGVARWLAAGSGRRFERGNAEDWGDDDSFDIATCIFVMHEMPRDARGNVMRNMLRLAPEALVVDICERYSPSEMMLWGEPYILEYQEHMDEDVQSVVDESPGTSSHKEVLVKDHVTLWRLARDAHADA